MAEDHDHEHPQPAPVTPYLTVSDANAAIDFYKRAFGARELSRQPSRDSSKLIHAAIEINGGPIFLSDDFPENNDGHAQTPEAFGGSPVTIHLEVAQADPAWERATNAGATAVLPMENTFWGSRYGILVDPFGHRWSIGGPIPE